VAGCCECGYEPYKQSVFPSAPDNLIFSVNTEVYFKMFFMLVTLNHVRSCVAAVRASHWVSDAESLQGAEPNSLPGRKPLFQLPSLA
jgi:hypothetical protein